MPMDKGRYPKDWAQISLAVREAAGWKCEWCGAPHGETILRAPDGFWSNAPALDYSDTVWHTDTGRVISLTMMASFREWDIERGPEGYLLPKCRLWNTRVVLTTAHLGPNKHNKMDCSRLAALCQSCHLREDAEEHAARRRRTLAAKKAQRQPVLELEFA